MPSLFDQNPGFHKSSLSFLETYGYPQVGLDLPQKIWTSSSETSKTKRLFVTKNAILPVAIADSIQVALHLHETKQFRETLICKTTFSPHHSA